MLLESSNQYKTLAMAGKSGILNDGTVSFMGKVKENPEQAFNVFLCGVGIVRKDDSVRVMLVDYRMNGKPNEKRLPGGVLRPGDILHCLSDISVSSELKKQMEIEATYLEMDDRFTVGSDHTYVAEKWAAFTSKLLVEINPMGPDFEKLVRCSYARALSREIAEEVSGSFDFAEACLVSTAGHHKKIGCLMSGFKAPDTLISSSEDDIAGSAMYPLQCAVKEISSRHMSALRAAISLFSVQNKDLKELKGMNS